MATEKGSYVISLSRALRHQGEMAIGLNVGVGQLGTPPVGEANLGRDLMSFFSFFFLLVQLKGEVFVVHIIFTGFLCYFMCFLIIVSSIIWLLLTLGLFCCYY